MKRIDLHLHTIPTAKDAHFVFSIKKLQEYVNTGIDAIALTNHNLFDIEQFNVIKKNVNCTVFPGVEVDLENGHILVIANPENLISFSEACKKLEFLNNDNSRTLSYEEFSKIFFNLDEYLFIPHYNKTQNLSTGTIEKFGTNIFAGEVSNHKKFITHKKNSNSLVPVVFSDMRLSDEIIDLPLTQTYLNIGETSFSAVKYALRDRNKVFISESNNEQFIILKNGIKASTGINVILGKRSSGKTYTLNEIFKSFANTKYIKQFSLLEKDSIKEKQKFAEKISDRELKIEEEFLKEFKEVCDVVLKIDLLTDDNDFTEYYDSLMSLAKFTQEKDIYAKTKLYNEELYQLLNNNKKSELIDAIQILLDSPNESKTIDEYLGIDNLKQLLKLFAKQKDAENYDRNIKELTNEVITNIKLKLGEKSNTPQIKDVSFTDIYLNLNKVEIFEKIVLKLKTPTSLERNNIHNFTVVANSIPIDSASVIRTKSRLRSGEFDQLFNMYSEPYKYLINLPKKMEISNTEAYRYFVQIKYKVLNKYGYEVSGGEMAEFNLLTELDESYKYDLLLIDEPESSFDNMFIKDSVNAMIKKVSKNMPVFIATHNNTIGASIKPDFILYTTRTIINNNVEYNIYTGYITSANLKDLNGNCVSTKEILYESLEAGEDAYKERRGIYEDIED